MHDNTNPEQYEEWPEGVSAEQDAQALARAGITGTIHVPQPTLLRAHRALLEKTFISSSDEVYFWVKTEYQALKTWHRLHTGWKVERRNDLFCLIRQPSALTLGVGDDSNDQLQPRDFVYLLWILWYAANDQIVKRGNGRLFLLLHMLEGLSEQWKISSCINELTLGENTDFSDQSPVMRNRKSMARALKYLQGLKCLKELDGQADNWVQQDSSVLYEFTPAIHLFIMSLDPKACDAVIAHQKEAIIFTPTVFVQQKEMQNALTRAWRALLIGPFLLRFDDPEAFYALIKHIDKVRDELDASFGWSLEVNPDYACIIQDVPSSSSLQLGTKSGGDQLVLLLCEELRSYVAANMLKPDPYGCITTSTLDLLDIFASMRNRYEEYWAKGLRDRESNSLLSETLKKMRHMGLIRGPDSKNTVLVLPTAARYSPRYIEHSDETSLPSSKRKEQADFQQINLWSAEETTEN